ncbi:MAG TPA: FkbM family methyltransferase, partial [Planctomycetota bacterium]|nr:FkbM family methyltransferase [Planctomycetota bacterium]
HPSDRTGPVRPQALAELRRWLAPGDVAIDVGAHSGDTALPLALAVGPEGCVLALEPNPYVFPVLAKNAELNPGRTRIVALPFAAAEADGPLEFEYSDAGFCNGGRHRGIRALRHGHFFRLAVEGRDLERYLRREHAELVPRVRFVKIDAEGYDAAVVGALRGLLAEARPFLQTEVFKHTDARQRAAFHALLESLGYRVHRVESESRLQGEPLAAEDMTRWKHFDVFCVPSGAR